MTAPPAPPSEPTVRYTSPPQKRPYSPVPTANSTTKKVKVEPSVISSKKKQSQQSTIKNEISTKSTVNHANTTKKPQSTQSNKSSTSLPEEKLAKNSNLTVLSTSTTNGSSEGEAIFSTHLFICSFFSVF